MFDYTKTEQRGMHGQPLSHHPHPDGKAWPKCCKNVGGLDGKLCCAFVPNQEFGPRLTKKEGARELVYTPGSSSGRVDKTPFVCVHRTTDDGYHRVCAGWDACFGNKTITAKSK